MKGYLYAVQFDTGVVKIGMTTQEIKQRMSQYGYNGLVVVNKFNTSFEVSDCKRGEKMAQEAKGN